MLFLSKCDDHLEIKVRIHPGAKKSAFNGTWNNEQLKINIQTPPVDGKANEALIAFLAKFFHIRKSAVLLLSGETSREKKLALYDIDEKTFLEKISPFL
ncbi:MAG: DUF167 domain-containing protein [Alphaproteobacteria bacterium]|nr:DUF167 domain-containing protein [Alphaproteobacteria bacterium]